MNEYITLKLSTEISSHDISEAERYLTIYKGDIIAYKENDTAFDGRKIGSIRVRIIDLLSLQYNEIDKEEFFDFDSEMDTYFNALFDCNTYILNEDIQDQYNAHESPVVCVIDLLRIDETHRGKGHGSEVINAVIGHLGTGCDLAVLHAQPLQYCEAFKSDSSLNQYSPFNEDEARSKLIKLYSKAGFKAYNTDGYMLMNLND